jgi:hypothetical protein
MFDPTFDPSSRRLHIRYSGFWSAVDARDIVKRFREVLRQASWDGAFTLLDDLREWPAQTQEVVEITKQLPDIVREMPVSRNAMIIEQALVRMQVNRTLKGLENCAVFATYEEADRWLSEVEPPQAA